MPSLRTLLSTLPFFALALALPRPQDPTDPQEPLPTFPGDGISYIGDAVGTITVYAYSGGPAWGCLDATGHVDKTGSNCGTFTATTIENSTYGSTIATSAGTCAFNGDDEYKFQCKQGLTGTGFYQIGQWMAHGYYKSLSYEAWYNWRADRVDEIVSRPSSGPVQYSALFQFTPAGSSS